MWRRFVPLETALLLALGLGLLLAGRSLMFRDPGTFWHVVAGQQMLDARHVIQTDSFSFTFAGRPWVADQWLAECGMAMLFRIGAWDTLLLAAAALLAWIYAYVGSRLIRGGLHALVAVVVLAVLLLASSPQFHVRPLVVTIVLLGLTFSWLVDVEAGRRGRRYLWWLVPVVALWANLHGGVLAGLGTLGLTLIGWSLMTAWQASPLGARMLEHAGDARTAPGSAPAMMGRTPPQGAAGAAVSILQWGLLLAVCSAAVWLNPYGGRLLAAWHDTLAMPLPELIQEHARLDLSAPVGWAVAALGLVYVLVLAGVLPRWPRVTWLLPLVWLVLAFQRVRNAPLFAVTAGIALADMLPYSRIAIWLARRDLFRFGGESPAATCAAGQQALADNGCPGQTPRPCCHWRRAMIPLAVLAAALACQAAAVRLPVLGRGWARFDPAVWPMELLPVLDEINRQNPDGTPIFNDLHFGGFLIYHTPRLRVFVDDRCSLYGGEFLQAYDHACRAEPAVLDTWQRRYGFHYALVLHASPLDQYLAASKAWTPLGRTANAALYRHDPAR